MTRYLEREIWRTLSKDERTILEASSLFRGLIPADSLHCFSDEWQAAIHGLQAKNLLAPTISGGVVVHDTIREYIRERLPQRSEEHTSELQSQSNLVCRLLLEKKKK